MNFVIVFLSSFLTALVFIFGKPILEKIRTWIGLEIDTVSREEAAMIFMERHVEFTWRPQIIDTPIATNVVNFDELKNKSLKKKERKNAYGFKTKI